MKLPMPTLLRGNARNLPLPDNSVDTVITSPPYFGLRSYTDGGEHYEGQLGSEATPVEFLDALIDCTREMVRVLKPSGSLFVNLGDKYSSGGRNAYALDTSARRRVSQTRPGDNAPPKSLLLLPERYRIAAVDELGLIARAVIVWSKPNGLPEKVTDRVRRSHEDWMHFTKEPHYYSAVDEIREPYQRQRQRDGVATAYGAGRHGTGTSTLCSSGKNLLGRLPGSVREVVSQPFKLPDHVSHARCCNGRKQAGCEDGVDHYAAFPAAWPRWLIQGWSPREVCTACGEGRWPVSEFEYQTIDKDRGTDTRGLALSDRRGHGQPHGNARRLSTITGYVCACPDTTAPATPGVVLDPFGGTGTTSLVATMLGRTGISVDLSADYGRLAQWRASDPKERARAAGEDAGKVTALIPGQIDLFGEVS